MNIYELERKIKALNKLLENEKRKVEKDKDSNVGRYYKVSDSCICYKSIGKVTDIYNNSDIFDYICDEVYFDTDYNELRNDSSEYRKIKELVFINKDEFDEMLEEMTNRLIEKFK